MPFTFDSTPGGAAANSYASVDDAKDYFAGRVTITEWDDADDPTRQSLLVMATRVIDMYFSGTRTFIVDEGEHPGYFRVGPRWTGTPSTSTQALAGPRIGMLNRNGFAIDPAVIPVELKQATAELAGQLAKADITLDNLNTIQGITSVRAGSVAVAFKNMGIVTTKMIPDAVWFMIPGSWYLDEYVDSAYGPPSFEVIL